MKLFNPVEKQAPKQNKNSRPVTKAEVFEIKANSNSFASKKYVKQKKKLNKKWLALLGIGLIAIPAVAIPTSITVTQAANTLISANAGGNAGGNVGSELPIIFFNNIRRRSASPFTYTATSVGVEVLRLNRVLTGGAQSRLTELQRYYTGSDLTLENVNLIRVDFTVTGEQQDIVIDLAGRNSSTNRYFVAGQDDLSNRVTLRRST